MSYVVVAEFLVRSDRAGAFRELMIRHAALSRGEPGCRAFDVNQDAAEPSKILLYEMYDDEASYIAHRATPHYARFREEAPTMLVPKGDEIFQRRSVLRRVAG